jgi:sugar lactone lactonase YvrE
LHEDRLHMKNRPLSRLFLSLMFAIIAVALGAVQIAAQTSPPMMVQVPFVNLAAGNLTPAGLATATPSSSCTAPIPTTGGANDGDNCAANQVGIATGSSMGAWGTAVDAWGNVYFGQTDYYISGGGWGGVRVIYAGPVIVGGTDTNPATAMIQAANVTRSGLTPAKGFVYTVAGGLQAAFSGASVSCGSGSVATTLTKNGSGCPATQSYIRGARGVAVDAEGNVFFADYQSSLIYVVLANAGGKGAALVTTENPSVTTPAVGTIYQLVGNTSSGLTDGVLANGAKVKNPYELVVDANENLYFTDNGNNAVRVVNGPSSTLGGVSSGYIHTIAGDCSATACTALAAAPSSNVPAVGTTASSAFVGPMGIAIDNYGNIYIGDNGGTTNVASVPSTVRVIYNGGAVLAHLICLENSSISSCPASLTVGNVYTIAGNGNPTTTTGNGALATSSSVKLDKIQGLAVDKSGNVYIADYDSKGLIEEVNAATGNLIFLAGTQQPQSSSGGAATYTAGQTNYCYGGTGGIAGPVYTDSYGDGCPAILGSMAHIEGNIAFDASGNLYFADNTNGLIRKLTFSTNFPATTVGSSSGPQYLAFSLLTGSTTGLSTSNVSVAVLTQGTATPSEFTNAGTGDSCTGAAFNGFSFSSTTLTNSQTTCVVPVAFKPMAAGLRTGAVQVTATLNTGTPPALTPVQTLTMTPAYLSGVGTGPALAIDPSTSTTIGTGTPQGVAADGSGNTYIAWADGSVSITNNGTQLTIASPGTTNSAYQVAVDGAGNVYVADAGNNHIDEFVAGASTPTVLGSGLAHPQGIAVDGAGNLYIADTGNSRVLFLPYHSTLQTTLGNGFGNPVAVAVDAANNLYVADSGLGAIVKIAADGTQTNVGNLNSISPISMAVDAAGDIYFADSQSKQILEIPVSGPSVPVISGLTAPSAVAIDAFGGLYVADTANSGVVYYNRLTASQTFPDQSTQLTATLTNIGNLPYSGTLSSSDTNNDFSVNCGGSTTLSLAAGEYCGLTANFNPPDSGNSTDTVSFTGSPVTLALAPPPHTLTSQTITNFVANPSNPIYAPGASFTASASASSGLTVTFASTTPSVCTVSGSTVTMVSAGICSLTANQAGDSTYAPATQQTLDVTIALAAPVATDQSLTVVYNTATPITLSATGSGTLTYSIVANPAHGTLSGTAPNLTYTPTSSYVGADSFSFKANNGTDSNTATVSITVNPLVAPVATSQSVTVGYNTATPITLSATGNGTLTYSLVASPAHGTLSGTAPNLTYTPTSGYSGTDTFTFKANNGTDSNVATVSITVNDAAPVANNQSVTVGYNTAASITLSATGNGTLTYSVVTGPAHGTLSGTAPNLTYTPNSGYAGADSFTFKANNGTDSNVATVSLTVNNAAPVANNQSITVAYNTVTAITLSATGNGTMTYSVVTGPAHGTLSGTAPNLTYTPTSGYVGADSFTFKANNGTDSNVATVSITVNNAAPVANGQSVTVAYNTAASITLSATGNGTLVYSVVTSPAHGTLSGTAPNLTYTPTSGYAGADSFTFKANNGTDSNLATVSITVNNAAPVANGQSVTVAYNTAKPITLSATGNGTLTYSVVSSAAHGTLSGTAPNLTYTPNSGYAGADSFTFKANNGTDSNTATVSVTVLNAAPVANSQTVTVAYNAAASITLSATGNGTLTFSIVANPAHGTLSGTAPNVIYTPTSGYAGADSFTFKANNGTDSNVATVSITVNNAAPVANNQSVTVGYNTATPITLSATGNGTLTYSVVANPAHGTLSGTAPNLSYTPTSGYAGTDSFTFKANNGTDSNVATVSIAVSAGFTPGSGGSTTATVTAGQPATYNLQFGGWAGATGTVTFSCTGAPLNATCTVNPGSATLSGTTPIPVTVSVATQTTTASMREAPAIPLRGKGFPTAVLAGVFGLAFGLRRRKKIVNLFYAGILCLALSATCFVTGCGGSSHAGSKTTPGTYPLTVTATASGVVQSVTLTLIVQ